MVNFTKSNLETESDKDGGKAKKANTINSDSDMFELGPDLVLALTHHLGTSNFGRSCTSHQFVTVEEVIVAIAMPIKQQGELDGDVNSVSF